MKSMKKNKNNKFDYEIQAFPKNNLFLFYTLNKTPCSMMNTLSSKNDHLKTVL